MAGSLDILQCGFEFLAQNRDILFENVLIVFNPNSCEECAHFLKQSPFRSTEMTFQTLDPSNFDELDPRLNSNGSNHLLPDPNLVALTLIIILHLDDLASRFMAKFEPAALHGSTWLVPNEVPNPVVDQLKLDSRIFQMVPSNNNNNNDEDDEDLQESGYEIQEIYRIGSETISLAFANYSVRNATLRRHNNEFLWSRRHDLGGLMFNVGYKENPGFNYRDENGELSGIMVDVLKIMAKKSNFSTNMLNTFDGTFGSLNANGIWSGNMGMLVNKTIDFAIADLSVTSQRSEAVSFTTGILIAANKLFMKVPRQGYAWTTFVDVFDNTFWTAMGVAFVITTLSLYVLFLFVNRETTIGFNTSLAISFLAFLALSVPTSPRQVPGRILFLSVLVMGSLCFWSYNAGLVSLLTVEVITLPIQTLEDLVEKQDYQLILEGSTSYEDYFRLATLSSNPTAAQLWEKSLKDNPKALITSTANIEDRLLNNDKEVYFGEDLSTILGMPNYPCQIVASQKSYFRVNIAWAFQKDSQYLEVFNYHLNKLKQTGHLDRILKTLITERPEVPCESGFQPIKIKAIFTAFIMLATGAASAVGLSIVERLVNRVKM